MNSLPTQQSQPASVDVLLSNGNRKKLPSPEGDGEISAVQAEAVRNLIEYECQLCYEVNEKPLQARCCGTILCASCYLLLPVPKYCPIDDKPFTGNITEDLKPADRLINNQIDRLLKLYDDTPPTGTDSEKSLAQNNTLDQLKESRDTGHGSARLPISPVQMAGNGNARVLESGSYIFGNKRINIVGGSANINGRKNRDQNRFSINTKPKYDHTITMINHSSMTEAVKTHHYSKNTISNLDIKTNMGDIVISGQNPANQDTVSITTDKEPVFRNQRLTVDCNSNILLKMPTVFNSTINLFTNMGNISTVDDYAVQSGGNINSNMGDINIKVDSQLVHVKAKSNMGNKNIRLAHKTLCWPRNELLLTSNMGNIAVHDLF